MAPRVGLWLTALLLAVGGMVLAGDVLASPTADPDAIKFGHSVLDLITELVVILAFATVGFVVAWRRPGHPVGWILLGSGWLMSLTVPARGYAQLALASGGDTRLVGWAAVVEMMAFAPAFGALVLILPLLFPDGRLPSPRWRIVAWISGLAIAGWTLVDVIRPGPLSGFPEIDNPAGIAAATGVVRAWEAVELWLWGPLLVAALFAVIVRFRRSGGVARQQFKWVAFPAVLLLIFIPLNDLIPDPSGVTGVMSSIMFIVAFGGLPVGVGMAVLRYRLYQIDRIVSRTVTYSLVVSTLFGVFVGTVLLLRSLLPLQGNLDVAASTLAVAALFNPLRRRVQGLVDRRFNRARYDAHQTIDAFSNRLRHNTHLDDLEVDLAEVIAETLQPATVGVWLKHGATAASGE